MKFEERLKEIRKKSYKRLKDGLGTEKNRVVRAILKEARILLAEVEKMQANYDYAYDFIIEAEFALSDILWVNELNEVVIAAPAAAEVVAAEDTFGFEVESEEPAAEAIEAAEAEEIAAPAEKIEAKRNVYIIAVTHLLVPLRGYIRPLHQCENIKHVEILNDEIKRLISMYYNDWNRFGTDFDKREELSEAIKLSNELFRILKAGAFTPTPKVEF